MPASGLPLARLWHASTSFAKVSYLIIMTQPHGKEQEIIHY